MKNNLRVGIISQARMTSTRLPGKVLLKANDETMLYYHINRLKWSEFPIYIATTINKTDEPIVDFCKAYNIPFYRGDENNVLSRYYECAVKYDLDIIVRVTSDCPLIDGNLVRDGINSFLNENNPNLYLSNIIGNTYPRGFDYEIFSIESLTEAYNKAITSYQKEHVTPFIIENVSGKIEFKKLGRYKNAGHFRLTLDTEEDFELIKKLIIEYNAEQLNCEEIIKIMESVPELHLINAHIKQKQI